MLPSNVLLANINTMDETQVTPAVVDDTQDPAIVAPEATEGEVVVETPAEEAVEEVQA